MNSLLILILIWSPAFSSALSLEQSYALLKEPRLTPSSTSKNREEVVRQLLLIEENPSILKSIKVESEQLDMARRSALIKLGQLYKVQDQLSGLIHSRLIQRVAESAHTPQEEEDLLALQTALSHLPPQRSITLFRQMGLPRDPRFQRTLYGCLAHSLDRMNSQNIDVPDLRTLLTDLDTMLNSTKRSREDLVEIARLKALERRIKLEKNLSPRLRQPANTSNWTPIVHENSSSQSIGAEWFWIGYSLAALIGLRLILSRNF